MVNYIHDLWEMHYKIKFKVYGMIQKNVYQVYSTASAIFSTIYRARKSRTTLQNKVRLKVLPEQLTLFVNTPVELKKCIIQ